LTRRTTVGPTLFLHVQLYAFSSLVTGLLFTFLQNIILLSNVGTAVNGD
jgi:hypothetical protein